jgi:hypothetical protein
MTFAFCLPRSPVATRPLPLRVARLRASFAGFFLLSPAIYYILPIAPVINLQIFAVRISHIEIPLGQSPDPPWLRKLRDLYFEPLSLVLGSGLFLLKTGYLRAEPSRHCMYVDAS